MRPLTGTNPSAKPTPLKAGRKGLPFSSTSDSGVHKSRPTGPEHNRSLQGPLWRVPTGECKTLSQQDGPMMLGDKRPVPPRFQETSLTLIGCFVTNWAALMGFRPKETQSWTDDCCWLPGRCCQGRGEKISCAR